MGGLEAEAEAGSVEVRYWHCRDALFISDYVNVYVSERPLISLAA